MHMSHIAIPLLKQQVNERIRVRRDTGVLTYSCARIGAYFSFMLLSNYKSFLN